MLKYYYQSVYMLSVLLCIPFFPILWLMGMYAKKKTGKLPDALDPEGVIEGETNGINLLTLGESTVAGVGVKQQKDGVTFHVGKKLNQETKKKVYWNAIGGTGYNVTRVVDELVPEIPEGFNPDYIVIMLGGNDTFELRSPLTWRKGMRTLLDTLNQRFPETLIVIANLPPVNDFTSFNPVLQWYLGSLTDLHRKVIMDLPAIYPNLIYMSEKIDFAGWMEKEGRRIPMQEFFSDGVHPSALTYRLWGEQIADRILKVAKSANKKSHSTT